MTSGVVLVGRVGTVRSDSFVLGADHKGGVAQEVEYKDVRDVKIRSTVTEKWIIGITIFLAFAGLNAWFGDPRSKPPKPGQPRGVARIP